ncbi:uncharacterized protein VTP21DRAFT_1597 [Calcarisporiella thermophila]|uniref:uncharacterized protein n=1 Tax=Calcarisporiella thermophila TaxID=911321 RepID=UPI0037430073
MAANFWASTQRAHWLLDRNRLIHSQREDLRHASASDLLKIKIWFANIIQKLGKRLSLRQQVIATAFVYFKRFYTKNCFCRTDPYLVLTTCVYLACKIEECPLHIKTVVAEMRALMQEYGGFNYDSAKVAEFEFYLLEELEFHLIVWHPYRTLLSIAKELGMRDLGIQHAWFIINDSYRTDVCLLYPPHMIALAAIFMTCVLDHGGEYLGESKGRDMKQWFADLNVEVEEIMEITQEILTLYEYWSEYKSDAIPSLLQKLREASTLS